MIDDFESDHYWTVIEDFFFELSETGVKAEDIQERTGDLLDVLKLNGWRIVSE